MAEREGGGGRSGTEKGEGERTETRSNSWVFPSLSLSLSLTPPVIIQNVVEHVRTNARGEEERRGISRVF